MPANIQIKLFATLRKLTPYTADSHPIKPGATVQSVIEELGIPANQAKLIFINSKRAELTSTLKDGDRLGIFPPVGGG